MEIQKHENTKIRKDEKSKTQKPQKHKNTKNKNRLGYRRNHFHTLPSEAPLPQIPISHFSLLHTCTTILYKAQDNSHMARSIKVSYDSLIPVLLLSYLASDLASRTASPPVTQTGPDFALCDLRPSGGGALRRGGRGGGEGGGVVAAERGVGGVIRDWGQYGWGAWGGCGISTALEWIYAIQRSNGDQQIIWHIELYIFISLLIFITEKKMIPAQSIHPLLYCPNNTIPRCACRGHCSTKARSSFVLV